MAKRTGKPSKAGKSSKKKKKIPIQKKPRKGQRKKLEIIRRVSFKKKHTDKCIRNKDPHPGPTAENKAQDIIQDFMKNGPCELYHILFLSEAILKNIEIQVATGSLELSIGHIETAEPPINLVYHKNGHWTVKLNEEHGCDKPNFCLFKAVSKQINISPEEIENLTLNEMKKNKAHIARKIGDIEFLELLNPLDLESGVIRYFGIDAADAKKILDESQKGICYPQNTVGHPRGHASCPTARGPLESVENYSRITGDSKTGFNSRSDQDHVTHLVLDSDYAQEVISRLNNGSTDEELKITREKLGVKLPTACLYKDGRRAGPPRKIREITAILRHHSKETNKRPARVFILTIFPRLKLPPQKYCNKLR